MLSRTIVLSYQYWRDTGKPVSLDFAYFMGKDSSELLVAVCSSFESYLKEIFILGHAYDSVSLFSRYLSVAD